MHGQSSSSTCPNTPQAVGVPIVALDERMPLHSKHQPTDLSLQANVYDESHLAPHPRLDSKAISGTSTAADLAQCPADASVWWNITAASDDIFLVMHA